MANAKKVRVQRAEAEVDEVADIHGIQLTPAGDLILLGPEGDMRVAYSHGQWRTVKTEDDPDGTARAARPQIVIPQLVPRAPGRGPGGVS
jgi:hypothetical protein